MCFLAGGVYVCRERGRGRERGWENRRVCVCGGCRWGRGRRRRGRSLNERFVLENGDHIPLCENGSCSRLRREREREGEEMAGEQVRKWRNSAVHSGRFCVCVRARLCFVCVSVQDFRSHSTVPLPPHTHTRMQRQPRKQVCLRSKVSAAQKGGRE